MANKNENSEEKKSKDIKEPIPTLPHPGGRPSECTPEMIIKGLEYIANYEKLDEVIPSIEGLALYLGVARKTIYNWAADDKNAEFIHIYEMCMAKQGKTLLNKGLNGDFNSTISKLILTKHNYVEQNDLTSNGQTIKVGFDSAFDNQNVKTPQQAEGNSKESKEI